MAKSTPKTSSKRDATSAAEIEADKKRLAELRAAKRDDDKDETAADDERDDDADMENAAEDNDSNEDDDGGDERAADDEDEDGSDKRNDERAMTAADVRKAAEAAVRADRIRGSKIREIAAQFGLPKLGERHANGETSVRAFKDLVLERLADRQRKRGNTTFAAAGTPEADERTPVSYPTGRDFEKGAAEARALLGLK